MPAFRRPSGARQLERQTGMLATAAIARMEETFAWYREMSAERRSWVGLVAQAGIAAFVEWYRDPSHPPEVTAEVFGAAPTELARAITLQQTVDLVRVTIEVVEERIDSLASGAEADRLRSAILRYSREVAFAVAAVYARAAEQRGAWDARLEALVVDALLRGEANAALAGRAAALGWNSPSHVVVAVGTAPDGDPESVVAEVNRVGRAAGLEVLAGVHGPRLVVVVGADTDPLTAVRAIDAQFGDGPIVIGPAVPELAGASGSARAALAGLDAVPAWPDAPRPVPADDLLPERALAGDAEARSALVAEVYRPLEAAGTGLLETVSAFLEQAESLEATARLLFVHPNTVRYRLRRVTDLTGVSATDRRGALALQLALAYGRLEDAAAPD